MPPVTSTRMRRWAIRTTFVVVLLALLYGSLYQHLRAAGLLMRMTHSTHFLAGFSRHAVAERRNVLRTPNGELRVRYYDPQGLQDPPTIVLVHGLQHLGIEEPRLVHFARTIAESGIQVVTPQLPGIERYELSRQTITAISDSVMSISAANRGRAVGVVGMSFSGGLALIAAAEPKVMPHVAFVAAIGAHHELSRVATFYATGEIPSPSGMIVKAKPHEYGALVIVFGSLEDFFTPADVPIAGETMRLLLYEDVAAARRQAQQLSPGGRATMERLFAHEQSGIQPALLRSIQRNQAHLAEMSPAGKLRGLQVPVMLLHGSADDIIPPSESLWLAQEAPNVSHTLVTPLLSHVDLQQVSWRDRLAVIHFMAILLWRASNT
jgi:pimeloyl-ACP methyl ester carboxylesterase